MKLILKKREKEIIDIVICSCCQRQYKRFKSGGRHPKTSCARGYKTITCSTKCSKYNQRKINATRNLKNYSKKYNIKVFRYTG